jgi:hypothetical protein
MDESTRKFLKTVGKVVIILFLIVAVGFGLLVGMCGGCR